VAPTSSTTETATLASRSSAGASRTSYHAAFAAAEAKVIAQYPNLPQSEGTTSAEHATYLNAIARVYSGLATVVAQLTPPSSLATVQAGYVANNKQLASLYRQLAVAVVSGSPADRTLVYQKLLGVARASAAELKELRAG
jgi:hypothetical protein